MQWNKRQVGDAGTRPDPAHLGLACVLNGFEPIASDHPFKALVIGPDTLASTLAADYPHSRIHALAAIAAQDNLTLLDGGLAQLAQADLPAFDFIFLQDCYAGATAEHKRTLIDIINRHLQPGGLVHIGYDAMPGCAAHLPLLRLLATQTDAAPWDQTCEAVQELLEHDAAYLQHNPAVAARWEKIKQQGPQALQQEALHGEPLYFADVARAFAAAKLDYACPADLSLAYPRHLFTSEQQDLLASAPDLVLRETLKDYLCNTEYRSDIFIRGARHMHRVRRQQWFERIGLSLTETEADSAPRLAAGQVEGNASIVTALRTALAEEPSTLAYLMALPALQSEGDEAILEAVALLVASAQVRPSFVPVSE